MPFKLAANAVHERQSTKKKLGFGKAWEVGDQVKAFYRLERDPETGTRGIVVASVWGHKVTDMKDFGLPTTFIPTTTEIDEFGNPIGEPDVTYKFSRIASAYIAGRKNAEIVKAKEKFAGDTDSLQTRLKTIEEKYDRQKHQDAPKPIIGFLEDVISTEVLVVKCKEGVPVPGAIPEIYTQSLSDERISKLTAIMMDNRYCPEDMNYLEVEYTFTAEDGKKSTAGRVSPTGQSSETRLEHTAPEAWPVIKAKIDGMITDEEVLRRRNWSFTPQTMSRVWNAIKMYCINHDEDLECLPDDVEENVLKNALMIRSLNIKLPAGLESKLNEAAEKQLSETKMEEATKVTEEAESILPPTMESLMAASTGMSVDDLNQLDDALLDPPIV